MASNSGPSEATDANAVNTTGPVETAAWTKYLPESFGIREGVRQSSFRWCVRESAMWGIATGTAMGFHRLRMQSKPRLALNVGFGTFLLVYAGSYYFCFRRRVSTGLVAYLFIQLQRDLNRFLPAPCTFLRNTKNK